MTANNINLWHKIKTEPPVAAAFATILLFSIPMIISMIFIGQILMPPGYTYTLTVHPLFGIIAILFDFFLVYLFSVSPVIRLKFHTILAPDRFRKALILFYLTITWISFYIINAKLNFLSSLVDSPIATMLGVGSGLVEEKLLGAFFLGISGCIGFALTRNEDHFGWRAASMFTMLAIVLFYFFVGRREISLMTLCFLLFVKRDKISRVYFIVAGILSLAILVFVLSLRISVQNNNEPLYAADSEELSPISYSAYILENSKPHLLRSFTEVTPLRSKLFPNTISAAYIQEQTGYNGVSNPVLGIGGVTYLYGFILPVIMLVMIGSVARSINNEYKIHKTPILKLLLIFITFKSINLFRNGEFPVVMIDILLFFVLMLPVMYLTFEKRETDQ